MIVIKRIDTLKNQYISWLKRKGATDIVEQEGHAFDYFVDVSTEINETRYNATFSVIRGVASIENRIDHPMMKSHDAHTIQEFQEVIGVEVQYDIEPAANSYKIATKNKRKYTENMVAQDIVTASKAGKFSCGPFPELSKEFVKLLTDKGYKVIETSREMQSDYSVIVMHSVSWDFD